MSRWWVGVRGSVSEQALTNPRHVQLAAAAGGLAAHQLPLPGILAAGIATALAVRAIPLVASRRRAVGIGVLVVVAGVLGQIRVGSLQRTTLRPAFGTAVQGDATLLTAPRADPFGGQRALASWHGERVLLRLPSWGQPGSASIGDRLHVQGRLRAPDRAASALEAHATLLAARFDSTGRRRAGPLGLVDGLRRRAQSAFSRALPPTEGALMAGMVLGQDEELPPDVQDEFRTAGLSHLVAASGQNVMLLVALALAASMALGLGFRARWAVVLALIVLYVPLAGGGAPIQRAGVTGIAMVAAAMAGRPASRWYALLLALSATLAFDPRSVGAVGWQLSFAAVVGIAVLARPARDGLRRAGVPPALAEVVGLTVAATLATAPLLAVHFGRVSLVALPANVVAAPAVPVVMWLGMVAAAAAQLSLPLASSIAAIAALPLAFLLWLARAAAAVPAAQVAAPTAVVAVVALGASVALALAGRARPGRPDGQARCRRLLVVVATAVGVAMVVGWGMRERLPALGPTDLRVTALDIGQGDATLVQVRDHAILVDAGPAGAPIVGELHEAGVDRLDALVVSHPQADHDGGAPAVLDRMPVSMLLDGRDGDRSATSLALDAPLRRQATRVVPARAGQELRAGPLTLRVLWPPVEDGMAGGDPNDRAVVAIASAYGSRALLTADAESPILAPLDLPPVELLKVSHHGSDDPGLPALLDRLRPRVALVEVGRHNTYGHPAPATLRALAAVVPTVRRTDLDGTVRVDLDHGAVADVVRE
ncbi:MAG TPA: ComEC/Rec2 family competence protein [Baekduia sp.]|nr:ComEC/Rec2 family competence protein [Baekduia sp.]